MNLIEKVKALFKRKKSVSIQDAGIMHEVVTILPPDVPEEPKEPQLKVVIVDQEEKPAKAGKPRPKKSKPNPKPVEDPETENEETERPKEQTPGKTETKILGRPPIWTDPDEFERRVNEYFEHCDNTIINKQVVQKGEVILVPTPKPYTMAGLAYWTGLSRSALNNYINSNHQTQWKERDPDIAERFVAVIAHARKRIEVQNIELGMIGAHESRLSALNLSSNYGYSTKEVQDVKTSGSITIVKTSYKGASGVNFDTGESQEQPQEEDPE